jgi:S-adenosylmethionine:tRNA-ribosyltransferase-isomerase (queuine synthetase)
MRVDLFDFELPSDRIALRPARPRDAARLLLVEGTVLSDRGVLELPDILRPGDVLVFNDTRVIPAQLEGRRGEASVGATLHKREDLRSWWAFVRNAKRVRDGDVIEFGNGVKASAIERDAEGAVLFTSMGTSRSSCYSNERGKCLCRPISPASAPPTSPIGRTIRRCSPGNRAPSLRRPQHSISPTG